MFRIRRLSTKLILSLLITIFILMLGYSYYLINEQTKQLEKRIYNKGVTYATTGAKMMQKTLEKIVDDGIFTINELFSFELVPIELPERIVDSYLKQVTPDKLEHIQKYHYKTSLDSYLDNTILEIQEQFLEDRQVFAAILMDKNGYIPTHNVRFSKPLTGDFEYDLKHNRTKRIFDIGKKAAEILKDRTRRYTRLTYKLDTGETVWNFSAPVYVKGKLWGTFNVGISTTDLQQLIAASRQKYLIIMLILMGAIVVVINVVTSLTLKPLKQLHIGAKRIASGDFDFKIQTNSSDEIKDLARTFNKMTEDLKKYIENLKKTTAEKERIESELKIARNIQMGILPKTFPPFPDRKEIDIYARLVPAREVGGDLYDFFFVDRDRLYFVIGDVSDKGVPASLFMVITRTLLKIKASNGMSPEKVLEEANRALSMDNPSKMFVTLFLGVLNVKTGELVYSNGGHNPPYVLKEDGSVSRVDMPGGIALGIFDRFQYSTKRLVLNKGDVLFLYTDGVTEAKNQKGEFFKESRLREMLAGIKSRDPEHIIEVTFNTLERFTEGTEQFDDITVLCIRFNGG